MNGEKYRDPTADMAISNAMKALKPKQYLPDDLYRAVKSMEAVMNLIGYEVNCMLITDTETGQKYMRGEVK